MRSVRPRSQILRFPNSQPTRSAPAELCEVGPLRRIELHQVEHDEIRSLRDRLLQLILDNERDRKVSRFRLVN